MEGRKIRMANTVEPSMETNIDFNRNDNTAITGESESNTATARGITLTIGRASPLWLGIHATL